MFVFLLLCFVKINEEFACFLCVCYQIVDNKNEFINCYICDYTIYKYLLAANYGEIILFISYPKQSTKKTNSRLKNHQKKKKKENNKEIMDNLIETVLYAIPSFFSSADRVVILSVQLFSAATQKCLHIICTWLSKCIRKRNESPSNI